MSVHASPVPPPHAPWQSAGAVHSDLQALADQMGRCQRSDSARLRAGQAGHRAWQWLKRHLVSIVVLFLLLGTLASARAAP